MQNRRWVKISRLEYGLVDISTVSTAKNGSFSAWYHDENNNCLVVRGSYLGRYMLTYSHAPAELIALCRELPGYQSSESNGAVEITCQWTSDTQVLKSYLDAIHKINPLDEIIGEIYPALQIPQQAKVVPFMKLLSRDTFVHILPKDIEDTSHSSPTPRFK